MRSNGVTYTNNGLFITKTIEQLLFGYESKLGKVAPIAGLRRDVRVKSDQQMIDEHR